MPDSEYGTRPIQEQETIALWTIAGNVDGIR
jgi:hypothetical protein